MRFGSKVCPNCNGKLDLKNGIFECSFCGCSFAADFDEEDVERVRKETEAERNAAKALRESELNRTREDLQNNRYVRPSSPATPVQYTQPVQQPGTQNTGRRTSKARIIIPIVVGSYILLQFIMIFVRSCMATQKTNTLESLFSKTTVATTEATEKTDETEYNFAFDASLIDSNEEEMNKFMEASQKILDSERLQDKYGMTGENELVAGYLFSVYYTNDLYLIYESKCTDDSTKYACVYFTTLLRNPDDTIHSDYTAHLYDVFDSTDEARKKIMEKYPGYDMSELDID